MHTPGIVVSHQLVPYPGGMYSAQLAQLGDNILNFSEALAKHKELYQLPEDFQLSMASLTDDTAAFYVALFTWTVGRNDHILRFGSTRTTEIQPGQVNEFSAKSIAYAIKPLLPVAPHHSVDIITDPSITVPPALFPLIQEELALNAEDEPWTITAHRNQKVLLTPQTQLLSMCLTLLLMRELQLPRTSAQQKVLDCFTVAYRVPTLRVTA